MHINTLLKLGILVPFAISCKGDILPQETAEVTELPQNIVAISSERFVSGESKANFNPSTLKMSWDVDDKIVVDGSTYARIGATNVFTYIQGGHPTSPDEGDKIALSPVSLYSENGEQSTAIYTLPTTYPWDSSTDSVNYVPLAGLLKNGKVTFHPLTSLLKITINNNSGIDVRLFGITLASDKIMSGEFSPSFDEQGKVTGITFTSAGKQSKIVNVYANNIQDTRDIGIIEDLVELKNGESYSLFLPVPANSYSYMNMKVIVIDESVPCTKYYNRTKTANLTCSIGKYYELNVSVGPGGFVPGINGNGTPDSPFCLGSLDDLHYIKAMVTSAQRSTKEYFCQANYRLEEDLTLPEAWTETMGESAIRGNQIPFSGVFDGNGHTISTGDCTNLKPMFHDFNNGTIKNLIIKGNFKQTRNNCPDTYVFSPFLFTGFGATNLVAVSFYGTITSDFFRPSVSIFGAGKTTGHLIGAYGEACLQANADYYSGNYKQLFSDEWDNSRNNTYSAEGVIGKITPVDTYGNPTGAACTHYHVKSNTLNTVESTSYVDKNTIVEELNQALEKWDDDLDARKNEIEANEYLSKYSGFRYELDGDDNIILVKLSDSNSE